jgi:hypothetical protein
MLSIQDRIEKSLKTLTYIGAGIGFAAFLVLGIVPGMLYGGYAGLAMAGNILGSPVEPTFLAKGITVGGIIFGTLASLFLFLVVGAFCGTIVGLVFRPVLAIQARHAHKLEARAHTLAEIDAIPDSATAKPQAPSRPQIPLHQRTGQPAAE